MLSATNLSADQFVSDFSSHLTPDIPIQYIIEKLHDLGPMYFNDKTTAYAELRIAGISKPFWVHKEYLETQSSFFKELFETVQNGDAVTISIPSPETFEAILEYLYDGDIQKWYSSLTLDNYYGVCQNVEFLGLGSDAKEVCLRFYHQEIKGLSQ